jgi:hypothetical protein
MRFTQVLEFAAEQRSWELQNESSRDAAQHQLEAEISARTARLQAAKENALLSAAAADDERRAKLRAAAKRAAREAGAQAEAAARTQVLGALFEQEALQEAELLQVGVYY